MTPLNVPGSKCALRGFYDTASFQSVDSRGANAAFMGRVCGMGEVKVRLMKRIMRTNE